MILKSVWTRDMFTCHTKSTEQRYKWEGRNGFRDGYSFISSTRYNSSKKGRKDLLVLLPFHYTRREITLFPSLMALSLSFCSQNFLAFLSVAFLSNSSHIKEEHLPFKQTRMIQPARVLKWSSGEQAHEEKDGKREIDTNSSFVSSFMSLVLRLFLLFFLSMALATSSPFFQLIRLTVLSTLFQDIDSKRVRYYKGNNITTTIRVDWVWASV